MPAGSNLGEDPIGAQKLALAVVGYDRPVCFFIWPAIFQKPAGDCAVGLAWRVQNPRASGIS